MRIIQEKWWAHIKRGLDKLYTTDVEDMYDRSKTKIRSLTGCTKAFQFYHGSALIPFLFIGILGVLHNA